MRLMNLYRKRSLRQKLILSSILCLVIPTIITLILSDYTSKKVLKEEAVRTASETLEVIEQYIENRINKMIYVSNFIQFDNEIRSIVMQRRNEHRLNLEPDEIELFESRKKITAKLDNISFPDEKTYITILLPDGTNYTNFPYYEFDPVGLFEEPWFVELPDFPASSTLWVGTHPAYIESERKQNEQFMTLVRTIKTFSSELYGYIIISISESQISRVFSNDRAEGEKLLLTGSGIILSHADKSQIGQPFAHSQALPEGESSSQFIHLNGEQYLVVANKTTYSDWYLLSMTPYDTALGQIHQILRTNVFLQIMFFSAFLIILVYLVRQFTKPIVRLGQIASEVESGNLDVRSRIRGPDEIGRLGRSFDQMLGRIQHMIEQITLEQTLKRKAELKMLQAQINPHFLFNILNSIRMKIWLKGDEENAALISSLAKLLRMTISQKDELVPLQEEVDTTVNYMKLMNFRHHGALKWEINLLEETLDEKVPRFFMQPLIENAIIHGFNQQKGTIRIFSRIAADELAIRIEDDGAGMNTERLNRLKENLKQPIHPERQEDESFSGIGVKNVYDRLRLIYGNRFNIEIESMPGQGTQITLYIPRAKEE